MPEWQAETANNISLVLCLLQVHYIIIWHGVTKPHRFIVFITCSFPSWSEYLHEWVNVCVAVCDERLCFFTVMSSRLRMETNIECTISLKENFNMIRILVSSYSILLFSHLLFSFCWTFSLSLYLSMSFFCRKKWIDIPFFTHQPTFLFICLFCISSTYREKLWETELSTY